MIRRFLSYVAKLYGWHKHVLRKDFDFDGHSLFAIIEYKLTRVKYALEHGMALQEEMEMRALDIAIKLARRLKEENYDERYYRKLRMKWGELTRHSIPSEDGKRTRLTFSRPLAVTAEQKELVRAAHAEGRRISDLVRERDQTYLYGILKKYLEIWWD